MQHYHQAISSAVTPTNASDLLSDGVFLRHFLLLLYDISAPMSTANDGADMWVEHLKRLCRLATLRHAGTRHEPLGYIIWSICELDMYACAMGSGSCEFLDTMLHRHMLPPLYQQIPDPGLPTRRPFLAGEEHLFPKILALNEGVVVRFAKLAQSARNLRMQASSLGTGPPSHSMCAQWQANVSQMQAGLSAFWLCSCPDFVNPETPIANVALPARVQFMYEQVSVGVTTRHEKEPRLNFNHQAFALYQTAILYSRTSMFPGQRLMGLSNHSALNADTDHRCASILTLAANLLRDQDRYPDLPPRHRMVFPIFIAGVTTASANAQRQALTMMYDHEAHGGIGQNTHQIRLLLAAVQDEQRRAMARGQAMEGVEWPRVARDRGLNVVNCGL